MANGNPDDANDALTLPLYCQVQRAQAWERAKGELRSMLPTYYDDIKQFERFQMGLDSFIEYVEAAELNT